MFSGTSGKEIFALQKRYTRIKSGPLIIFGTRTFRLARRKFTAFMKSAPDFSGLFGHAIFLKGPHSTRSSRNVRVVFLRDRIAPTSAAYGYEHMLCKYCTSHLLLPELRKFWRPSALRFGMQ